MPALIPLDNSLGVLFIGTVLSSIIYGITLLQVYSYCNSHCSRDRWPLKFLVALLLLVDTFNLFCATYTTYYLAITNFGDYSAFVYLPWTLPTIALSASFLEVAVQHFYAYRIYLLSERSPYLPVAISIISLTAFGKGVELGIKGLKRIDQTGGSFRNLYVTTLSLDVSADVLITIGMVYTLLRNRTRVQTTNSVLNTLAVYAINCGILTLVFTISGIVLLLVYPDALIYLVPAFIVIRLYFCALMAILNSRNKLRATLDGREIVLGSMPTNPTLSDMHAACGVEVTTESSSNITHSKIRSPVQVSPYAASTGSINLDREKYPVPAVLMGQDEQ